MICRKVSTDYLWSISWISIHHKTAFVRPSSFPAQSRTPLTSWSSRKSTTSRSSRSSPKTRSSAPSRPKIAPRFFGSGLGSMLRCWRPDRSTSSDGFAAMTSLPNCPSEKCRWSDEVKNRLCRTFRKLLMCSRFHSNLKGELQLWSCRSG